MYNIHSRSYLLPTVLTLNVHHGKGSKIYHRPHKAVIFVPQIELL